MFALVFIAVLCYVTGGSGLALAFLAPADSGFPQPNVDLAITILAIGVLFHALSKVLDHLEEINDSLKKIADKE